VDTAAAVSTPSVVSGGGDGRMGGMQPRWVRVTVVVVVVLLAVALALSVVPSFAAGSVGG